MIARSKVLVVDDDPASLKIAHAALVAEYDVVTVPTAEKLNRMLEIGVPDLILLDILLKDGDGRDIISMLKVLDRTKDVPVIFLTSQSSAEDEIKGLALGAVDYIAKPVNPELLRRRVEIHTQLVRQRRELAFINAHLQRLVSERMQSVLRLQKGLLKTVGDLVEFRDDVTGQHTARTERMFGLILESVHGIRMYSEETVNWEIDLMVESSQLHDVGKIAIPDAVLLKPAKLTAEEFAIMKMHAKFGEEIIERIQENAGEQNAFLEYAKILAGSHHERWDGSGYPRGLKENDIPLAGRLMAFADVYDALVSSRPYKPPFPHEKAVQIISGQFGSQFDPNLADAFLSSAERFINESGNGGGTAEG